MKPAIQKTSPSTRPFNTDSCLISRLASAGDVRQLLSSQCSCLSGRRVSSKTLPSQSPYRQHCHLLPQGRISCLVLDTIQYHLTPPRILEEVILDDMSKFVALSSMFGPMLGKKSPVKPGAGDRVGPSVRLWRSHFSPKRTRALPWRDSSGMTVGHLPRSSGPHPEFRDSPGDKSTLAVGIRAIAAADHTGVLPDRHLDSSLLKVTWSVAISSDPPGGLVSDPHRSANTGSAGTGVSGIWWGSGSCFSLAVTSRVL
ncbi:LOW QUALITY PROTEIN: hypothetical protein MC885_021527 [Smutsia gigantea]|nr:LOW QUALITY PROTEIN: hypothetical protein MC885_021527 [Smutsia gigantea]